VGPATALGSLIGEAAEVLPVIMAQQPFEEGRPSDAALARALPWVVPFRALHACLFNPWSAWSAWLAGTRKVPATVVVTGARHGSAHGLGVRFSLPRLVPHRAGSAQSWRVLRCWTGRGLGLGSAGIVRALRALRCQTRAAS